MEIYTSLKLRPGIDAKTPKQEGDNLPNATVSGDTITFTRQAATELHEDSYRFDKLFHADTTDQELYQYFKAQVFQNFKEHHQSCLFLVFGGKGSGKTTTLYGNNTSGLLLKLLHDLSSHSDKVHLNGSYLLMSERNITFDLLTANPYISQIEHLSSKSACKQLKSMKVVNDKSNRNNTECMKIKLSSEQRIVDFLLLAESNRWIYETTIPQSRYDTLLKLSYIYPDKDASDTFRSCSMYIIEVGNISDTIPRLDAIGNAIDSRDSLVQLAVRKAIREQYCIHLLGCIFDDQAHFAENLETCRFAVALKETLEDKYLYFTAQNDLDATQTSIVQNVDSTELEKDLLFSPQAVPAPESSAASSPGQVNKKRSRSSTKKMKRVIEQEEESETDVNTSETEDNDDNDSDMDSSFEEMTLDEMDVITHKLEPYPSLIRCRVCGHKKRSICTTCSRYFQVTIGICGDCEENHFYKITSPETIHYLMKHVDGARKGKNLPPFTFERNPKAVAGLPDYQAAFPASGNQRGKKRKTQSHSPKTSPRKKSKRRG